jgi:hypothetical protein
VVEIFESQNFKLLMTVPQVALFPFRNLSVQPLNDAHAFVAKIKQKWAFVKRQWAIDTN